MFREFYYGGQALIEGVMMRGERSIAIAVRRPNGELSTTTKPLDSLYTGRMRKTPVIRGVIVLIETLVLGIKYLLYSANVSLEKEEVKISTALALGVVTFAFVLAIGLFIVIPLLLTHWLDPYIASSVVSNLVDGVFRLVIFILYLWGIGLMPDIKRVFAYHGAEHKTINAYEDGAPMEVEAVRGYSTAHTRCGTGFILIVFVFAILLFAFLGRPELWLRLLSRLALLPVIAALGYEFVRFGAAHSKNRIVHAILTPGLMLQSLTTRQPDDSQIEVGISALKAVLEDDRAQADVVT